MIQKNTPLRTTAIIFAALFDKLTVNRYNQDGTLSDAKQSVPIVYANKMSYYTYIEQQLLRAPNSEYVEFGRRFPRMSYEMVGIQQDEQKQLNPLAYHDVLHHDENEGVYSEIRYTPAAYIFNYQLSIWCKDMDTSIQILDQILPYFKPDVFVKIKEETAIPVLNDIGIVLKSAQKTDNYAEGLSENRLIQWDLDFDIYANIWAKDKLQNGTPINEIIVDINNMMLEIHKDINNE